jgi:aryl-alcohol dehydrogenase-like predicted oxidoreductase
MHRWDVDTPIDETLRTLDDLITQGKVRYIGSSAFASWQIAHSQDMAEMHGWNKFISDQPHYNMLARDIEKEVIPACEYFGIGILPYFPLAGGFLTGKYKRGQSAPKGSRGETSEYVQRFMTDENYDILDQLTAFAQERDHTIGELAHAWLLANPVISSVISGATKVEHVQANAKSVEWEMTTEELEEVKQILDGGKT